MPRSVHPLKAQSVMAEFFNEWPLYTPFVIRFTQPAPHDPNVPRRILRNCQLCESVTTWERSHPRAFSGSGMSMPVGDGEVTLWTCTHCSRQMVRVWYLREYDRPDSDDSGDPPPSRGMVLRKLGQWPPQEVEPVREVEKALGEQTLEMYRKGLTSLSHGYGLAAVAYFRRVVEDATSAVLNLAIEAAEAAEREEDAARVRQIKESRPADDKLKEAAKHLPPSLRPGGVNPLDALYDHYSRGLHGLSDEDCLSIGRALHTSLEHVFLHWRVRLDADERYRSEIQGLSDPAAAPEKA